MSLLAVVSLVAFVAVGLTTQNNMLASIDATLQNAVDGSRNDDGSLPYVGQDNQNGGGGGLPAYSVTVTWDGSIYADSNLNAQMNTDVLTDAVQNALSQKIQKYGSTMGRVEAYNLYYMVKICDVGYRVAFVDSSSHDSSVQKMRFSFVVGWILLMLVLLAVTLYLSRYVTRPVAAAWENQQRFIADASHELKTPLTVILADASILAQSPQKTVAEQQNWIDDITSEAERMRRLTEEMLTLARADAGEQVIPTMSCVDLSQLTQRVALQFEPAAFERGLIINDDIETGLEVMGAQDRLDNLLKTLLENACKYGVGSGEPVTVTLKREGKRAVLRVSNGGAIPPEDLPHVFDRFYRSDKSRVQEGESLSFGLGLSIAKSTAELHGGNITVSSGAGITTFTVGLPLVKQ